MKTSNDTTCTTAELLDRIRMTDSERLAARAALAQGERIADLLLAAFAPLKSAALQVGREPGMLARSRSFR